MFPRHGPYPRSPDRPGRRPAPPATRRHVDHRCWAHRLRSSGGGAGGRGARKAQLTLTKEGQL
eukprot:5862881-Lingulodinium_polyedra.AAC.1